MVQIDLLAQKGKGISEQLKLAFFFSCFAGLRWSDCSKLKWAQVSKQKMEGQQITVLHLKQMKTEHSAHVKLSEQAGLERLYFHLARHTFATLTLSEGADLYTVSKLLGHTDIHNTMIYAHVVDRLKMQAVARLPKLVGNLLVGKRKMKKVS